MGNEWSEVQATYWKPEKEGDSIEGVYLSMESDQGNSKSSKLYHLETDKGIVSVWGSAIIDDRMKHLQFGSVVKIQFVRLDKNKKGQKLKLYRVFVK